MAFNVTFAILIIGLLVAAVELFSLVSARLDLVCLGFVLVVGGLAGVFSGSLLLSFGVVFGLGTGYLLVLRKRVRKWIEQAEKA